MKKRILIIFSTVLLSTMLFTIDTETVNSQSNDIPDFPKSSKDNQQLFGYFILDIYHDDIYQAIEDYYKDSTVHGYDTPGWKKHDMVSITEANNNIEGNDERNQSYSYVIKITLLPTNEKGIHLGTDTLYFAVEPKRYSSQQDPNEFPSIKLIKYEHKALQKKH
ncbi:hypothetical protein ACFQ3N_05215 [Virgibacillus byunsanensis]|uniref:DUF3888 domain-containing protein n=1 Tax=Virgibacillus byunsanensis TaxID=570945 RepID=A0ABW3LHD5_9BACI